MSRSRSRSNDRKKYSRNRSNSSNSIDARNDSGMNSRDDRDRNDRDRSDRDRSDRDRNDRNRSDRNRNDRDKSRERGDRRKRSRERSDREISDRNGRDRSRERGDRSGRDRSREKGDRRDRSNERKEKDRSDRNNDNSREKRNDIYTDNDKQTSSSSVTMSLYEQMNSIMSKSERRDVDPLIIDSSKVVWGKHESLLREDDNDKKEEEAPKFKADFGLSGALAKDEKTGNIVNGVVLKFTEPVDAAIPKQLWRFYVFKGDEIIETLHVHRQSAFLLGRDDRIADLLITHPSCSKQHAVLQFRSQEIRTSTGVIREIKPYIMDLGSVHKTYLNNNVIDDARYYELRHKDMLKFGSSTREYVLILADS